MKSQKTASVKSQKMTSVTSQKATSVKRQKTASMKQVKLSLPKPQPNIKTIDTVSLKSRLFNIFNVLNFSKKVFMQYKSLRTIPTHLCILMMMVPHLFTSY
jgi:hypothetical protein